MNKIELQKSIRMAIPSVYNESYSYLELLTNVIEKVNELVPAMNGITDNIDDICEDVLNQFLIDGELGVDTNYDSADESLSFVFSKVTLTRSTAGKVVVK